MTINNEYKDFFNTTEYLPKESAEICYKKRIINEEKLIKETEDQDLCSFEKIPAEKILGILTYLKYKLEKKKEESLKLKLFFDEKMKESDYDDDITNNDGYSKLDYYYYYDNTLVHGDIQDIDDDTEKFSQIIDDDITNNDGYSKLDYYYDNTLVHGDIQDVDDDTEKFSQIIDKEKHTEESLKQKVAASKEEVLWFEKSINFLNQKLNVIDYSNTFITPIYAFFYKKFEKIGYKNENQVGRLYNKNSINTLSREIRYYLLKDEYTNFDIVNAHPTILFEFAKEHSLKLNGSLENYIKNKSSVFDQIRKEKKTNDKNSDSDIKREILRTLNSTWESNSYFYTSITLKKLDEDFTVIRNHLWSLFQSKKLPLEYTHVLNTSIEKKKKENKDSPEQRLVLQYYYCQIQESVHILRLVKFLRKKYIECLKKEEKEHFTDYYPITDKKVTLPATYTLSVIPFFDCIYISSPNQVFNSNLLSFVDEYNKQSGSVIYFERKEITQRVEHLTNIEEITSFMLIKRWLARPSSQAAINFFITKMSIQQSFLEQQKSLDKRLNDDSHNTYFTEEEEFEEWKTHYKELIKKFHHKIYDELLPHKFDSEDQINKYIESLKK